MFLHRWKLTKNGYFGITFSIEENNVFYVSPTSVGANYRGKGKVIFSLFFLLFFNRPRRIEGR